MRAQGRRRSSAYAQQVSTCSFSLQSVVAVQPCERWPRRDTAKSSSDRLLVGGLPAPRARPVAAFRYALLVDLRDDIAVAGQQRLGRTHLRAERKFSFGQPVGAVLFELFLAVVGVGAVGAEGALVHFAARSEIPDLGILRRAERTGVEAVAAADAQILRVK